MSEQPKPKCAHCGREIDPSKEEIFGEPPYALCSECYYDIEDTLYYGDEDEE